MKPHVRPLLAAALALCVMMGSAAAQEPPKPSHLEAAKALVIASGLSKSFDGMIPGLIQQVRRILVTRPELTKDLEEVITKVGPEFDKNRLELIDQAARIFAKHMTEQELKESTAFFNSPVGKRYIEAQPLIINEMYAELETWSQRTSAALVERIRVEMRARGQQF